MKLAVLNYQTGKVDILENVPDEEELKIYFIDHPVQNALHKLARTDDVFCFIEVYLEEIGRYHMSEIDWMKIDDINFRKMENI